MIAPTKILCSDSGVRIRQEDVIRAGGQGTAYWATDMATGEKGVLKLFSPLFSTPAAAARTRFLVSQNLPEVCVSLNAPIECFTRRGIVGHYARTAPGITLEQFLAEPNATLVGALQVGAALAQSVALLHDLDIAHGDLHSDNVFVEREGSVWRVALIDFDNYSAAGQEAPPCIGHDLYMAPELRMKLKERKPGSPNLETDRYALGVLMHEVVLGLHLSAGADSDADLFEQAMCSGRWIHDPAAPNRPSEVVGGYPVEILNTQLCRLFRRSVSLMPDARPDAVSWREALVEAMRAVYICPHCSGPCIADAGKHTCPFCKQPYPVLELVTNIATRIRLDAAAVVVGRAQIHGSQKVSSLHAVFRRIGPETFIEPLGSNGTFRWNGGR